MPEYRCPNHPEFVAESIGGWKNHRTRMDGGWDDADLAEATGASPSAESVRERMSRFAQTMPDSASGIRRLRRGHRLATRLYPQMCLRHQKFAVYAVRLRNSKSFSLRFQKWYLSVTALHLTMRIKTR